MKTKFKLLGLLAMAAVVLTGCSKDSDGVDVKKGNGKRSVTLQIVQPTTKAPVDELAPITDESTLQTNLLVYAFDVATQTCEVEGQSITLSSGTATTDVTVTVGPERFYVFSVNANIKNQMDVAVAALKAAGTLNIANFEKIAIESGLLLATGEDLPIDIAASAASTGFMIGSSWGETVNIPEDDEKDDDDNDPVDLTVTIGRAAARIKLTSIAWAGSATNSELQGAFLVSDITYPPTYRIGAVPYDFHLVGQYTGTKLPSYISSEDNQGVEVTSLVHDAAWNNGTSGTWNTAIFRPNTSYAFKPINATALTMGNFFYAVENTTNSLTSSSENNLRYGNTTFMQVKVKYAPVAAEIINTTTFLADGTLSAIGSSLTGSTFYTGVVAGKRYIFDADPTSQYLDANTDVNTYTDGWNYYKFPIMDNDETKPICIYRVLRNFYYNVSISDISDLGSPVEEVDPEEPIDREFNVRLSIEIAPWSVVEQPGVIL